MKNNGSGAKGLIPAVELVGLPGAGKTSLCLNLLRSCSAARPSWVSRCRVWLRRSRISRLFLPVTLYTFRRPLRLVAGSSSAAGHQSEETPSFVRLHRLAGAALGLGKRCDPDFRRLVASLNTVLFEYWLARLEAFFRRRTVVFDEGLIQRGTALWLVAPSSIRQVVWDEFLQCLPAQIGCVLLCCKPQEAYRRTITRGRGVPWSFSRGVNGGEVEEIILRAYRQVSDLLVSQQLAGSLRLAKIEDVEGEHAVGAVAQLLRDEFQYVEFLVLARPRTPD